MIYRDFKDFEQRGLDPDIVQLRFKHYQHRLIDTLNRVIEKRRIIKEEEKRVATRVQKIDVEVDIKPKAKMSGLSKAILNKVHLNESYREMNIS